MKLCSKCQTLKDIQYFCKDKNRKDGLSSWCKDCTRESNRRYRLNNREKINKFANKYYHEVRKFKINKKIQKEKRRIYYLKTRDSFKEYYIKNKNKIAARVKERYNNDIIFKLKRTIRRRVLKILKGYPKNKRTTELLGCDGIFLKQYLEGKFIEGMNWENHGKWHIDHIIPLDAINRYEYGTDEFWKLFEKLCHYSNLQPMWGSENISKGNKFLEENLIFLENKQKESI